MSCDWSRPEVNAQTVYVGCCQEVPGWRKGHANRRHGNQETVHQAEDGRLIKVIIDLKGCE